MIDSSVSNNDTFDSAVLVKDRIYTDIKVFDNHKSTGQEFVVRLRNNSKFIKKKSLQRLRISESSVYEDFTCILGTDQSHSSLKHRVVFFKEYRGKEIKLFISIHNILQNFLKTSVIII